MEKNEKKNQKVFFLIRGKVSPERILLAEGKILSYKNYLDTIQYRIRIEKFRHRSFLRFKKLFIGEKYFAKRYHKRMNNIIRSSKNMLEVNDQLKDHHMVTYTDQLYIFQTMNALLKHYRVLQEFYMRRHIKQLRDILSDNNYKGAFKMGKDEFNKRFISGFLDTYKQSFNDETIKDFLKNL